MSDNFSMHTSEIDELGQGILRNIEEYESTLNAITNEVAKLEGVWVGESYVNFKARYDEGLRMLNDLDAELKKVGNEIVDTAAEGASAISDLEKQMNN